MSEGYGSMEELTREYPIIQDPEFLRRYPGIGEVVHFIYTFGEALGTPPLFEGLDLSSVGEFLDVLERGDMLSSNFLPVYRAYRKVRAAYEKIREIRERSESLDQS